MGIFTQTHSKMIVWFILILRKLLKVQKLGTKNAILIKFTWYIFENICYGFWGIGGSPISILKVKLDGNVKNLICQICFLKNSKFIF